MNVYGTHDALTLIPLYQLSTSTSLSTMPGLPGRRRSLVARRVRVRAAAAAAVGAVRADRRAASRVGASSSRFVVDQARAQQRDFLGDDPSWVDHAGGTRVAYLYDGEPSWPGVWETVFFNTTSTASTTWTSRPCPGRCRRTHVTVRADGTVVGPPADRRRDEVRDRLELDRARTASAKGEVDAAGADPGGARPLEARAAAAAALAGSPGCEPNGDIAGEARLVAYECKSGTFSVTLLIKQPEKVDIRLDGKLVRHLEFPAPTTWHGDLPVPERPGGTCTLAVEPTGLAGTTVFEFDRG